MSGPGAIPLFGDAYLADTTYLTTEEHGAYLLLMMAAWRQEDCGLPLNDKKLARIAGLSTRKWAAIRDIILAFWRVENGRIYQPRLSKEHDFVCKKSNTNRNSANARWAKQALEKQQEGVMRTQCEGNAPPPPPIPLAKAKGNSEKQFWDSAVAYIGDRGKVAKLLKGRKREDVAAAITEAQLAGAVDPFPYVQAILNRQQKLSTEMPIC